MSCLCSCPCTLLKSHQVQELQALRQQLEAEVDIPQLQPLRDEVERLDELLQALSKLQVRMQKPAGRTSRDGPGAVCRRFWRQLGGWGILVLQQAWST